MARLRFSPPTASAVALFIVAIALARSAETRPMPVDWHPSPPGVSIPGQDPKFVGKRVPVPWEDMRLSTRVKIVVIVTLTAASPFLVACCGIWILRPLPAHKQVWEKAEAKRRKMEDANLAAAETSARASARANLRRRAAATELCKAEKVDKKDRSDKIGRSRRPSTEATASKNRDYQLLEQVACETDGDPAALPAVEDGEQPAAAGGNQMEGRSGVAKVPKPRRRNPAHGAAAAEGLCGTADIATATCDDGDWSDAGSDAALLAGEEEEARQGKITSEEEPLGFEEDEVEEEFEEEATEEEDGESEDTEGGDEVEDSASVDGLEDEETTDQEGSNGMEDGDAEWTTVEGNLGLGAVPAMLALAAEVQGQRLDEESEVVPEPDDVDEEERVLTVSVVSQGGEVNETFEVQPTDTARTLLSWVNMQPGQNGRLLHCGRKLPMGVALEQCGVRDGDRIELALERSTDFRDFCGVWLRVERRSKDKAAAWREERIELTKDGSVSYEKIERSDDGAGSKEENEVKGAGVWNLQFGELEVFCAIEQKFVANGNEQPISSGNVRLQMPSEDFAEKYTKVA